MGIFIDFLNILFILPSLLEKVRENVMEGSWKSHCRNFILGFLYEPCNVVFGLKYWTQVLLCCVLPVKTPFFWQVLCYQSYDIFRHKAKDLWISMSMILSYGWFVQKLMKYQVGIKWIVNEKLTWTPNNIYDVSWRVLKSSGPHEFVECRGVNERLAPGNPTLWRSSSHTKIFRVERARLKTGEKITDSL